MLELECQRMSVPKNMPEQPVTTTRTLDIDDCIAHKIFANCTTVKSMAKECSPPKCTAWRETPNTDDGTMMGPRVCCLSLWIFHRHVIKKFHKQICCTFHKLRANGRRAELHLALLLACGSCQDSADGNPLSPRVSKPGWSNVISVRHTHISIYNIEHNM